MPQEPYHPAYQEKVITNFKPILNPEYGFPIINYVFIALHNPTEAQENEFINFMNRIIK